jgi:hypothetical protein
MYLVCAVVLERKRKMDTTRLIRDLRGEKGRIERAIAALEALGTAGDETADSLAIPLPPMKENTR